MLAATLEAAPRKSSPTMRVWLPPCARRRSPRPPVRISGSACPLGARRPIDRVERDAVAAEAASGRRRWPDRAASSRRASRRSPAAIELLADRVRCQDEALVHLASEAPIGGHVDEDDMPVCDQPPIAAASKRATARRRLASRRGAARAARARRRRCSAAAALRAHHAPRAGARSAATSAKQQRRERCRRDVAALRREHRDQPRAPSPRAPGRGRAAAATIQRPGRGSSRARPGSAATAR